MSAKPIPSDHQTVTPYLTVRGAAKVVDFLKQAFDAEVEHEPIKRQDGTIMHVEVKVGDSYVMIAEESEMCKATPSTLYKQRRRHIPGRHVFRKLSDIVH